MSKQKTRYDRPIYDDDGLRKPALREIKRDKDRKRSRNLDNALRSRNLDMIRDYEDE